MGRHRFFIVDVFTEEKYSGNQLAVVMGAGDLSDIEMQQMAKEMNYSETTFIISDKPDNGGYNVRIFTPREEIPFAGHPTLGTAYVIQHELLKYPVNDLLLNLKAGQIPVLFCDDGLLWMEQKQPEFGRILDPGTICKVLNIDAEAIDDRYPVQEVSTGLPFIIVPLCSLDVQQQIHLNRDRYFRLISEGDAKAILVFCPETLDQDNDLNVRVFAEYYGIAEDPATGSANGCLAGYLVRNRYFGTGSIDIRIEQGHQVDRPSLLHLRARDGGKDIDVEVGGKVIMVARGEFV